MLRVCRLPMERLTAAFTLLHTPYFNSFQHEQGVVSYVLNCSLVVVAGRSHQGEKPQSP